MPTDIILTETESTNTLLPNFALSNFLLLDTTQTIQDKINTPNNADAVAWATLAYQKLNMDPTISSLTRKYCDTFKWIVHLVESCWKRVLPFLPPHIRNQMHQ